MLPGELASVYRRAEEGGHSLQGLTSKEPLHTWLAAPSPWRRHSHVPPPLLDTATRIALPSPDIEPQTQPTPEAQTHRRYESNPRGYRLHLVPHTNVQSSLAGQLQSGSFFVLRCRF